MKNRRFRAAFTLLEVLIAVLIVSFLGGVVYSVFFQGVRVWHFAGRGGADLSVDVLTEKMTMDLRNTFFSSVQRFVGDAGSLEFATLRDRAKKGEVSPRSVVVKYYFDATNRRLEMTEREYVNGANPAPSIFKSDKLLEGVRTCRFEYYTYDQKSRSYSWQGNWQADCIPLAVRMNLSVKEEFGERVFLQVLAIPVGGCKE